MQNMILNYQDRWNSVWFMTKTRLDNDVTDCGGSLYVEFETKLSCPIW